MTNLFRHAALGALLLTTSAVVPATAAPLYHLVATVPLGGGVKWDYVKVDGHNHRVYVSHGTEETVVSLTTHKIVGELTGLDGSHDIAVDPATGNIWADSRTKNEVIAFSPKTFRQVAAVPVPAGADGMAYDGASKTLFIGAGDSNGVVAVDPASRTAYPEIALGSATEGLVAGKGSLYVALVDANEIARIDTKTRQVVATWPTTGCESAPRRSGRSPSVCSTRSRCSGRWPASRCPPSTSARTPSSWTR